MVAEPRFTFVQSIGARHIETWVQDGMSGCPDDLSTITAIAFIVLATCLPRHIHIGLGIHACIEYLLLHTPPYTTLSALSETKKNEGVSESRTYPNFTLYRGCCMYRSRFMADPRTLVSNSPEHPIGRPNDGQMESQRSFDLEVRMYACLTGSDSIPTETENERRAACQAKN